MERQRQMTRQRLEAKRRKREEQQYEEDMAASIVTMAEKRNALIREKTMLRREGHKDAVSVELLLEQGNSLMQYSGITLFLNVPIIQFNFFDSFAKV